MTDQMDTESTQTAAQYLQGHINDNTQGLVDSIARMQAENVELHRRINALSTQAPVPTPVPAPAINPTLDSQLAEAMKILLAKKPVDIRSEKLPDISEYDGEEAKLDSWEQSLIQRMHVNHDRYPTDVAKIAYAENRLTIGKRAHNLMNAYRLDGICTLKTFFEWRTALRKACGNPFEQEDARKYLRETLKQGTLSFEEYYNLFAQKKDRSKMEDASLIDAMKSNINYVIQAAAVHYRVPGTNLEPVTFDQHVAMWLNTDRKIRQIKHLAPNNRTIPTSTTTSSQRKDNATITLAAPLARTPDIPSAPVPTSSIGDPMELSQAMAAVKGKSLKTEGMRDICDKWNLCHYCKQKHPGKTAIDCPNKKSSLRSSDTTSISELEDSKKA